MNDYKKGVFRTLEALIAIFITFTFLAFYLPQQREEARPEAPQGILSGLRGNDEFRSCVIQKNSTCINQTLGKNLEDRYDFSFNISEDPNAAPQGLPQKRVYANSIFLAGNTTNSTSLVVRLYFWDR